MRRSDREVKKPEEILRIMKDCLVLHLALYGSETPYLIPVNFGMESDGWTLYFHGAMEGTKYRLIEADARAGFEMDHTGSLIVDEKTGMCTMRYESVAGWGVLSEVADPGEKRLALERIMAQYGREKVYIKETAIPHTRIFKLCVKERTAKKNM